MVFVSENNYTERKLWESIIIPCFLHFERDGKIPEESEYKILKEREEPLRAIFPKIWWEMEEAYLAKITDK